MVKIDSMAWLPKDKIKDISSLKRDLTIIPRDSGYGNKEPQPIYLYNNLKDTIGVPREFYLDKVSLSDCELDLSGGVKLDGCEFNGTLSPDQKKGYDVVINCFSNNKRLGGILNMPVGTGKTVTALAIVQGLGVKTLVIVHKEFLIRQWKDRINQFLPNARIGHIQQDKCDYKDKDIVIGMVHSLAGKDYDSKMYSDFGLIISDEVHRLAAPTWSLALPKFNSRWRLGLSATPRRKDGTTNVFKYHIGDIIYTTSGERLVPKIRKVSTPYRFFKSSTFNPDRLPLSKVITMLSKAKTRNEIIIRQICGALEMDRNILVLSHRLNHLSELSEMYKRRVKSSDNFSLVSSDFYIGGRTEEELKIAEKARLLFATYQMAQEGLDIPKLDTLILATPMSDIIQSVGRILRVHDEKKEPIVVDIIDDRVKMCKKLYFLRNKTYLSKGWV